MAKNIATFESVRLNGKKVLVRVDLNSPLDENKRIIDDSRIKVHAETVKFLAEINASVVVLSHQGRPGIEDFTDLSEHAKILEKYVGFPVEFVDDIIGPEARRKISSIGKGEIIMLDNVRLLAEESIEASGDFHARSFLVQKLYKYFDYFVNDAFATAHRKHASIVGFPYVLPSLAGKIMEKEILALKDIKDPSLSPKVFVLGGAKITDSIRIISNIVKSNKGTVVLLTGLVSELFVLASGIDIGRKNKEKIEKAGGLSLLPHARELYLSYKDRIYLPMDYVVEDGREVDVNSLKNEEQLIKDIGGKTIESYTKVLENAEVVIMRGPAGVIEEPMFRRGSIELVTRAAKTNSKVILGGGHLTAVMDLLPQDLKNKIHNSTGGGALLLYLAGEPLAGVDALAYSAKKFNLPGILIED